MLQATILTLPLVTDISELTCNQETQIGFIPKIDVGTPQKSSEITKWILRKFLLYAMLLPSYYEVSLSASSALKPNQICRNIDQAEPAEK